MRLERRRTRFVGEAEDSSSEESAFHTRFELRH